MTEPKSIKKLILVEGLSNINDHLALGFEPFGSIFVKNNIENLAMYTTVTPSAPVEIIETVVVKKAKRA